MLSALGIANSYGKSGTITRAEFTETAMRAIGLGDIPKDGRNLFLDVDADASYSKYINAAYDLNIVSGSDGLFNPDTPITYADAVVIAVKILGRNDEAKSLGAYPYGYEKSARRHGFFSGVEFLAEYDDYLYINCDDYNNTALINAEDIISFYNLTYEYNENGKTKTKKMSSDASFIYNGRPIADNGTALYTPENGYLVLIDNNQNGAYDIAVINACADLVVGDVDIENKTIYDAYKMGESVCFDRDDDVSVGLKDSAGKNLYFGMVKKRKYTYCF